MDDRDDLKDQYEGEESSPGNSPAALVTLSLIAFAFLCLAAGGLYYAWRYKAQVSDLSAQSDQMSASLAQARSQLNDLSTKLTALNTPSTAQPPSAATKETSKGAKGESVNPTTGHRHAKRAKAEDPRWKQMQDALAEHQKEIDSARDDIQKNRGDLEAELTQSHDELNGTIARNHDELVALEKRGERNFTEFDLTKSKQFHRVGPLSISLHKVNQKRGYADMDILIDDNRITEKHVNLLQPVQFYPNDYAQPVEVVINHLDKNRAAGYVSIPKLKQSEMSASGTPVSSTNPVPGATQNGPGLVSRPADHQ